MLYVALLTNGPTDGPPFKELLVGIYKLYIYFQRTERRTDWKYKRNYIDTLDTKRLN